jgi:cathepsin B
MVFKYDKFTRSFGTILRDNKQVDEIAKTFPTLTIDMLQKFDVPAKFDGRPVWLDTLTPISEMYDCGRGWIFALVECLSSRYNIFTPFQYNILLSSIQPIFCPDERINDIINLTEGDSSMSLKECPSCVNTVYYGLKYLFVHGVCTTACMIYEEAVKAKGVQEVCQYTSLKELKPTCNIIFGSDEDECYDKNRAMRFFRCSTFANVEPNEETIKKEIYDNGPVVCSYQVYEDFINEYDGLTVYTGPKTGAKLLGGHSGKIVGWGEDKNKTPYWIVSNSWSTSWGIEGYFYMKRGSNVCKIEENIVTIFPDFATGYKNFPDDISIQDKNLISFRDELKLDPFNYYKPVTIKKIQEDKLKGDLNPYWDIQLIPNIFNQRAGEINRYPLLYKVEKLNIIKILIALGIALVIGGFLGFLLNLTLKRKGKKRRKRSK